jgi:uncharacterized membrane protein HdeD (DUF308 family)
MSENSANTQTMSGVCEVVGAEQIEREFRHLKADWWWLLLYGVLLAVCGTAVVIFPKLAAMTSFAAIVLLGVALIVAGISTIIAAFWAGKWSGVMLQLIVGVLYLAVGFIVMENPWLKSIEALTLFLATFLIVVGTFRILVSLMVRFPFWGWSLLNGIVTLVLGVIIYRLYQQFPVSSIWILGLLIGVEMLLNGWTWIMLSVAVRNIPEKAAG